MEKSKYGKDKKVKDEDKDESDTNKDKDKDDEVSNKSGRSFQKDGQDQGITLGLDGKIDEPKTKDAKFNADKGSDMPSSGTDNSRDVLGSAYITGERATEVKINNNGDLLSIGDHKLRGQVLGEGMLGNVSNSEPVANYSNKVVSTAGYGKINDALNTMKFILDEKTNLEIIYPIPRYETIPEIWLWMDYIIYENRILKLVYKAPFEFGSKDFESFLTLYNKLFDAGLAIGRKYDVIRVDNPVDQYSMVTNQRSAQNLNIKGDYATQCNPAVMFQTIYGLDVPYSDLMSDYLLTATTKKLQVENKRLRSPFKIDDLSYALYLHFSRPPIVNGNPVNQGLQIPPDFTIGQYSVNEINAFMNATSTPFVFPRERSQELKNPAVVNRTFKRDLLNYGNVVFMLTKYRVLFDLFTEDIDKIWMRAIKSQIQISTVEINQFSEYYSNTVNGISAFRRTAITTVISSISPAAAPGFIDMLFQIYSNPRAVVEFHINSNYNVAWTFNCMMFMFMFKPQVCARPHAMALVVQMLSNLCKICSIQYANVQTAFTALGYNIPTQAVLLLQRWYNYANSPVSRSADYAALYTNMGYAVNPNAYMAVGVINPMIGAPDTSGLKFWRKPAYYPWANVPTSETDRNWSDALKALLGEIGNFKGLKFDWAQIWESFMTVLTLGLDHSLTTGIYRLITVFNMYSSTEIFTNRFQVVNRDHVVPVDSSSFLSFAAYGRVEQVVTIQKYIPSFYAYMSSLDYWLSELNMLFQMSDRIEKFLINYTGISGVSTNFFKPWSVFRFVGERCSHPKIRNKFIQANQDNFIVYSYAISGDVAKVPLAVALAGRYNTDLTVGINSRWHPYVAGVDFMINTKNWKYWYINSSIKITPLKIDAVTNNIFRFKSSRRPDSALSLNYKQIYFRFGELATMTKFSKIVPFEAMSVKIPTFVNYKYVENFSDVTKFKASTGEAKLDDWLYTRKPIITSEDFKLHFVELEQEYAIRYNPTFQENKVLLELYGGLTDFKYFILPDQPNDVFHLLHLRTVVFDVYLSEFVDSTVEICNGFPSTNVFGNPYVGLIIPIQQSI